MSAILTHDCPHCGTRSVAMNYQGHTAKRRDNSYYSVWFLLACGNCESGTTALFKIHVNHISENLQLAQQPSFFGSFAKLDFDFQHLLPNRSIGAAPNGTPDRVCKIFEQATSNLANNNWDASGAMSRKCLDVSTKILARNRLIEAKDLASAEKAALKNRIEILHKHNLITDEIAELAMLIKNEGNDASHDEDEYSQEEATALIEFTKVFLTYVFTIPHMVASVKPVEAESETK